MTINAKVIDKSGDIRFMQMLDDADTYRVTFIERGRRGSVTGTYEEMRRIFLRKCIERNAARRRPTK